MGYTGAKKVIDDMGFPVIGEYTYRGYFLKNYGEDGWKVFAMKNGEVDTECLAVRHLKCLAIKAVDELLNHGK
jgi:hypothetical protein